MAKQAFWASRPFGYGEIPMLDVGQIIEIVPGEQRNDEKLIRLGLLREVGPTKPAQCGKCGAKFIDEGYLNWHGRNRHDLSAVESGRREAPESDAKTAEALGNLRALEAADEFAEKHIPLNLDKTKASQEGRSARRASR